MDGTELIQIKVTGFDSPNRWYRNFLGTTFTVKEHDNPDSYEVVGMLSEHGTIYRIEKTDCRIETVEDVVERLMRPLKLYLEKEEVWLGEQKRRLETPSLKDVKNKNDE